MTPTTETPHYIVRHARPADIPAMRAMQQRSMWVLGGNFYSDEEIAGFLTQYGTMDDAMVDEGHFLVAVNKTGRILGSGGWTRRIPAYAGDLGESHGTEALPTVRSVFVDPAVERRGIASSIMARLERDAVEHGICELSLTATLPGAALYERLGYRRLEAMQLALNSDTGFACIRMTKQLEGPTNGPHEMKGLVVGRHSRRVTRAWELRHQTSEHCTRREPSAESAAYARSGPPRIRLRPIPLSERFQLRSVKGARRRRPFPSINE